MAKIIISFSVSASLLVLLMLIAKTTSAPTYRVCFCANDTAGATFEPKSEYESNLNAVLKSLTSNSTNPSGFSAASSGATTTTTANAVYGLFLCRGDQDRNGCRSCATTATSDLRQKYCPNGKGAVIWYDECMVRYSNESFLGKVDSDPAALFENIKNITGDPKKFLRDLGKVMQNVSTTAANGGSKKKFATEIDYLNISQNKTTLYTLAQCTPDLSAVDCEKCLKIAIDQLPTSKGGRVLQPSCNVRYEMYPFFIGATAANSTSPPGSNTTAQLPVVSPPKGKKKLSAGMIIAIVVPVVVIVVGLLVLGVCFINKKTKKRDVVAIESGKDFSDSLQYDLGTLQYATNNFSESNKLGQGGFGAVYKGVLANGQEIAVKKLSENSCQGVQEFKNEAMLVAKLQHRNLVRLLGFCLDGDEKLLVYEYVPNKSLDYFLFDTEKKGKLNWERRYKIITGIARGMLYIHQDSQLRIIHRDLKTSNILLDEDMNPKISDFGMARIFGTEQTQGSTSRVVGTHGYMSPEYAMHGQYSVKSDVYSFGIIVLEIISGMKNSSFYGLGDDEDLLSHAWKHWGNKTPLEFIDPTIKNSCSTPEVMRCLHLALLCAQESIDDRPTMATIVLTLDTNSVTLPVPDQPGLILKIKGTKSNSAANTSWPDQSPRKSRSVTINTISVTEIDPR